MITSSNRLVSNHTNWELNYKDENLKFDLPLIERITLGVMITAIWPALFVLNALVLTAHSFNYLKAKWKQHKTINILMKNQIPEKYVEKRVQFCEKEIVKLKSNVIFHMERLEKLGYLPEDKLHISPQLSRLSQLSQTAIKDWDNLQWNTLLTIDFFQSNIETSDEEALKQLKEIQWRFKCLAKSQTQINSLSRQKEVLSNSNNEQRLEVIKKIAEMSFIKTAFNMQKTKRMSQECFYVGLLPLPLTLFLKAYCGISIKPYNDQLTYEGNKDFLPAQTDLKDSYNDLVEAHNALAKNYNFIVPYIEDSIE